MKLMVVVQGVASPYQAGQWRRRVPTVESPAPVKPKEGSGGDEAAPTARELRAASAYRKITHPTAAPVRVMLASDLMSSPVDTILPSTLLEEVHQRFTKKRYRHLVISDDGKKLRGLVSDRDLLEKGMIHRGRPVSDIMTDEVLVASPATPIREIARVLFEERVGAMPIVDENNDLAGLITRSDILRAVIQHAPLDMWI